MDEPPRDELREIDEGLAAVRLPFGLEQRIADSIQTRATRTSTRMIALTVAAVAVLAFMLGQRTAPRSERTTPAAELTVSPTAPEPAVVVAPATPTPRALWNERLLAAADCEVEEDGSALRVSKGCQLRLLDPPLTIDSWRSSRLARSGNGVRILDGAVSFAVEPVPAGAPRTRVEVAAGAIEVLGTRFVVEQTGERGHVDLLEGAIDFVTSDGITRTVEPGRRLSWAAGSIEPPHVIAAAPLPGPSRNADRGEIVDRGALDTTLEQVAALRRAGRYREAIAMLNRARRAVPDSAAAEILSYEEGTLRMHDDDNAEICAFWRGHIARFGASGNAVSIRAHMKTAACDEQ